jgi:hypothetical protein
MKSRNHDKNPDNLYQRANERWKKGRLRIAFRLFLAAARAGSISALGIVGYFYDDGIGVKSNRNAALYWYKRAYRRGSALAANNIAVIWRDRHRPDRAMVWFKRAVMLGSTDSNLDIGEILLRNPRNRRRAMSYLTKTCKSRSATQGSREQARALLMDLRKAK